MFFALAIAAESRRHVHVHHSHHHFHSQPELESNANGYQIADMAKSKIGCAYVYGAAGPNTFDCSGLVMWVHNQFGIRPPRVASEQASWGRAGDGSVGDVIAFGRPAYHVGICIGNGNFVHAPQPGETVKITGIQYMDKVRTYRRFY